MSESYDQSSSDDEGSEYEQELELEEEESDFEEEELKPSGKKRTVGGGGPARPAPGESDAR